MFGWPFLGAAGLAIFACLAAFVAGFEGHTITMLVLLAVMVLLTVNLYHGTFYA